MSSLVFSYGSNLCLPRILARTPNARLVATGSVSGYRFAFHKRGRDGSAKADAWFTGEQNHRVWGAVFALNKREKRDLDHCEGLGRGYAEAAVAVETDTGTVEANVYVAQQEYIEPGLQPYCWYRQFVLTGAAHHALPADYVAQIAAGPFRVDPDQARRESNRSILLSSTVACGE